jgi:hypothetical protein
MPKKYNGITIAIYMCIGQYFVIYSIAFYKLAYYFVCKIVKSDIWLAVKQK